ncbi:UNVERIFIED_CONTAM: hypothetical protein HDU68_000029 [Siphonaria sp. JEL0065]|nr:hypothetical protein HDU68_000029 [Siphonaria sp. JEL0065]
MPVIHTVTWTILPGVTKDQVAAARDALLTLTAIPGCTRVQFGETFTTDRSRGYTHQLVVELADKETLPLYAKHPMHVAVLTNHLKPIFDLSTTLAIDFEC